MDSKTKSTIEACSITDDIFSKLIKNFSSFKTEKDIDKFIRSEARKRTNDQSGVGGV